MAGPLAEQSRNWSRSSGRFSVIADHVSHIFIFVFIIYYLCFFRFSILLLLIIFLKILTCYTTWETKWTTTTTTTHVSLPQMICVCVIPNWIESFSVSTIAICYSICYFIFVYIFNSCTTGSCRATAPIWSCWTKQADSSACRPISTRTCPFRPPWKSPSAVSASHQSLTNFTFSLSFFRFFLMRYLAGIRRNVKRPLQPNNFSITNILDSAIICVWSCSSNHALFFTTTRQTLPFFLFFFYVSRKENLDPLGEGSFNQNSYYIL